MAQFAQWGPQVDSQPSGKCPALKTSSHHSQERNYSQSWISPILTSKWWSMEEIHNNHIPLRVCIIIHVYPSVLHLPLQFFRVNGQYPPRIAACMCPSRRYIGHRFHRRRALEEFGLGSGSSRESWDLPNDEQVWINASIRQVSGSLHDSPGLKPTSRRLKPSGMFLPLQLSHNSSLSYVVR